MPLKQLKLIVIEAETRPLELFLAFGNGIWAAWLSVVNLSDNHPVFWEAIRRNGGVYFWISWAAFNFGFQLMSLVFKYPKFRRWASASCAIYWIMAAISIWKMNPYAFTVWTACGFAAGQLWIILHRASIGR